VLISGAWGADRSAVSQESDGTRTLEGHVRITLISTDAQPLIASAMKAVLTPESGGGLKIKLEHASVIGPSGAD
jgi:hypothetical protein